jgi:imidazolonepropionase-like amidohydrolase
MPGRDAIVKRTASVLIYRVFMIKRLAALIFLLALAAPWRETAAHPLAFTHVTVIDTNGGEPLADMSVVVDGKRIVEVAHAVEFHPTRGTKVIDARGKYLIPGLWDMHVHTVFGDWVPQNEKVTLPLFVANGITGVRDMGGDLAVLKQWRAQIAAGSLLGPQMIIAGPMLDGPVPHFPSSAPIANAADGRRVVDELKSQGVDFIKIQSYIPREGYFAAADEAKKLGMVFVGHVPDAIRASEASDAGQRSIEYFTGIFEGCSTIEDQLIQGPKSLGRNVSTYDVARARAVIALMAKNQTWQVPTLVWEHGHGWSTTSISATIR